MRALLVALLTLHGSIHLMGFVKAFGFAEIAELQQHIAPRVGLLWLAAAALLLSAALLLVLLPRFWWVPALAGVGVSQLLIVGAWSDARFGTIANLLILVPLVLAITTSLGGRGAAWPAAPAQSSHAGSPVSRP